MDLSLGASIRKKIALRRRATTLRNQTADTLRRYGVPTNANEWRIRALRNHHAGQRCFIIGNGPSLTMDDLGKLTREVSIASNQIYVAFNDTPWRPTYYSVVDRVIAKSHADDIRAVPAVKFIPDFAAAEFTASANTLFYRHDAVHDVNGALVPTFSDNILDRIYGGRSITFINLQLAFYMGCTDVYLLGMDHNYNMDPAAPAPGALATHAGQRSHFHSGYFKPGETFFVPDFVAVEAFYAEAKARFESAGRSIYNATRGGKLEIFPRVNFDDLFAS